MGAPTPDGRADEHEGRSEGHGRSREQDSELVGPVIHHLEYLMGAPEEHEEGPVHEQEGHGVQDGAAARHHSAKGIEGGAGLKRATILEGQRLAESGGPCRDHHGQEQPNGVHPAPRRRPEDSFGDQRGHYGANQEDSRDGGHHAGHPVAGVQVPEDGQVHQRAGRGAKSPDSAAGQQEPEVGGQHRPGGTGRIDGHACSQGGHTAESVRDRSVDDLAAGHPEEVDGDGQGDPVGSQWETHVGSHLVERRERGVDAVGH